jgi:hypothetical protein
MTTPPLRKFLIFASLSFALLASAALAKTVAVGTCLPRQLSYPTISQALAAVGPGYTIMICAGTYPEQLTITQPVTLVGEQSAGAANPTIIAPPGGLTQSVTLLSNGVPAFFQIMVQGTEAGLVNISNLAIDGTNNLVPSDNAMLGIYYQNSSGAIRNIVASNQIAYGSGFGIFLESTTSPTKTITVSNSSIHDYDSGGIRCNCNSSITVSINTNSVVASNSAGTNPPGEGIDISSPGQIVNNSVISNPAPPAVSAGTGIVVESNVAVTGNTVVGWGIFAAGDSNTIKSNRVLKADGGIGIGGTSNDVEFNFLANFPGGAGISFNCTGSGNTVIHNTINDAYWGILDPHGTNTVAPNTFTNVANLTSPPC